MDIEAIIGDLGTHLDPAEAAIAERLLREYGGITPHKLDAIGLSLAIHRRQQKA